MSKERFIKFIYPVFGSGGVTGYDGGDLGSIGDQLQVEYSDEKSEIFEVENLQTNELDNPLNGLLEITVKLYLKKVNNDHI